MGLQKYRLDVGFHDLLNNVVVDLAHLQRNELSICGLRIIGNLATLFMVVVVAHVLYFFQSSKCYSSEIIVAFTFLGSGLRSQC